MYFPRLRSAPSGCQASQAEDSFYIFRSKRITSKNNKDVYF